MRAPVIALAMKIMTRSGHSNSINSGEEMQRFIKKLIPKVIKQKLKETSFFEHKAVADLATTSKRIDICSAQMAHIFIYQNMLLLKVRCV
jgi:hypothetical protein